MKYDQCDRNIKSVQDGYIELINHVLFRAQEDQLYFKSKKSPAGMNGYETRRGKRTGTLLKTDPIKEFKNSYIRWMAGQYAIKIIIDKKYIYMKDKVRLLA